MRPWPNCAVGNHPFICCPMHLWDGERVITICSQEHRNEYEHIHRVVLTPIDDEVERALASIERMETR